MRSQTSSSGRQICVTAGFCGEKENKERAKRRRNMGACCIAAGNLNMPRTHTDKQTDRYDWRGGFLCLLQECLGFTCASLEPDNISPLLPSTVIALRQPHAKGLLSINEAGKIWAISTFAARWHFENSAICLGTRNCSTCRADLCNIF